MVSASLGCGGAEPEFDPGPKAHPRIVPVATLESEPSDISAIPRATPHADPGEGQEVRLGQRVHVDGSASTDDNGGALHFIWSLEQRPSLSQLELGTDAPFTPEGEGRISFLPDRMGTFGIGLVVEDQDSRSPQAFAFVRVLGPERMPVAHVSTSSVAHVGETVLFDASASENPLAHVSPLEFYWEPARLPEASRCLGTVTGEDGPELRFVPDVPGRYVFLLVVRAAGVESAVQYAGLDVAP